MGYSNQRSNHQIPLLHDLKQDYGESMMNSSTKYVAHLLRRLYPNKSINDSSLMSDAESILIPKKQA